METRARELRQPLRRTRCGGSGGGTARAGGGREGGGERATVARQSSKVAAAAAEYVVPAQSVCRGIKDACTGTPSGSRAVSWLSGWGAGRRAPLVRPRLFWEARKRKDGSQKGAVLSRCIQIGNAVANFRTCLEGGVLSWAGFSKMTVFHPNLPFAGRCSLKHTPTATKSKRTCSIFRPLGLGKISFLAPRQPLPDAPMAAF